MLLKSTRQQREDNYQCHQYIFILKQIQLMNLRNHGKERLYEKNSVDSNNCCDAHLHRLSAMFHQTKFSISQDKSRSKSRERGISLTHQSLSLQKLANPKLKLSIVHNSQKLIPQIPPLKNYPTSKDEWLKVSNVKKPKLVQRCVNYKNSRIQQRNYFSKEQSYIYQEKPIKGQDDISTCKNTPRIETCSISSQFKAEMTNKVNICSINPQNSPLIDINIIKSKLDENQKILHEIKSRPAKTSFQKLFEQHQGRKIVTIQSNEAPYSQMGEINDYSVTQSFVFGNRLN